MNSNSVLLHDNTGLIYSSSLIGVMPLLSCSKCNEVHKPVPVGSLIMYNVIYEGGNFPKYDKDTNGHHGYKHIILSCVFLIYGHDNMNYNTHDI